MRDDERDLLERCRPSEDYESTNTLYGVPVERIPKDVLRRVAAKGWIERIPTPLGTVAYLTDAGHIALSEAVQPTEVLSSNQYSLLCLLQDQGAEKITMQDLATLPGNPVRSREHCGKLCRELARRGLVEYDAKKGEGAAITAYGLKLLINGRDVT